MKADGVPQDLRLPLPDGAKLQILTTRDTQDPDALAVLRHSAAHLLAEAVRRLYPGVKVAIGPPIENGFYYDFEFPTPISDADLEAIEAEVQRELGEGRAWEREEITADEARERFDGRGRALQGRARRHRRGRDLALHPGRLHRSLPRPAPADLGADQGVQAHLARRRLLARRLGEHPADADLRDGVLQPEGPRRAPRAARARRRRATIGGSATQLDLFHFDEHSPGSPFWHPKGMAIFNALEDLRRRENARRGYSEVKTPLIYDKALWVTSGHWEKFRENMFLIPVDDEHTYAIKPMNCPGHMLLFGSQLRSYRDLPLRFAEAAPLHRNELAGSAARAHPRPLRDPGRRAHLLHRRSRSTPSWTACLEYLRYLYGLFGIEPRAELSTRPDNKLGHATRSGTSPRAS